MNKITYQEISSNNLKWLTKRMIKLTLYLASLLMT